MKLTKYGTREWLGGGLIALAVVVVGLGIAFNLSAIAGWAIVFFAVAAWLAVAAFFRVPYRSISYGTDILVSPADGVVMDIGIVKDHGIALFGSEPVMRIGIFLSVLNVHVNRAPADMRIIHRTYKPGRFLDARDPHCTKENESLVIAGLASLGNASIPVAVRQISGAIARRIVCEFQQGDFLEKGQIYGMIKFGSRTELYFPANQQINPTIAIGTKVLSGTTIIARLQP